MVRKDRCYSLDRAMELPVIGPYVTTDSDSGVRGHHVH
jgi:hypothetical protein